MHGEELSAIAFSICAASSSCWFILILEVRESLYSWVEECQWDNEFMSQNIKITCLATHCRPLHCKIHLDKSSHITFLSKCPYPHLGLFDTALLSLPEVVVSPEKSNETVAKCQFHQFMIIVHVHRCNV